MVSNVLPLRVAFPPGITVAELMNGVSRELLATTRHPRFPLADYAHQDVPFERRVEHLNPERSLARHPLFQVMLSMQNTPHIALRLPGATASPLPVRIDTAKFDLSFQLGERFDENGAPTGIEGASSSPPTSSTVPRPRRWPGGSPGCWRWSQPTPTHRWIPWTYCPRQSASGSSTRGSRPCTKPRRARCRSSSRTSQLALPTRPPWSSARLLSRTGS